MSNRKTILLTDVESRETKCKACHAPVRWARTERGRRILLEAAASFLDDPAGRRVYADYVHFANCPYANDFRAKRERDARYPPHRRYHGD